MAGLDIVRFGRRRGNLATPRRVPGVSSAAGIEMASGTGALVASASVEATGDRRAAMRNRNLRQGWQQEAYAYLDGVGELRYAVQTSANAISRVRLFPALQVDPKAAPVPLSDLGTSEVPSAVAAAAQEDMDTLNEPGHGLSAMQHVQSISKQVVGEYYVVGLPFDPDTGEESWSIRSIDELVTDSNGQYWLRDRPPGFAGYQDDPVPLGDDAFVARCWDQHPRFRALAWSQMRPLLESLEELLLASRMIRSTLRSRIAGAGLLLVPDELELLGVDPTNQDPLANPFFQELTKAMLTPIQSEGDASEVVPLVVRGPGEILKELRHLTLDRPIDQTAMAIRGELIRRIAIGIDWPPELLLGVGDVSHWAQWFVDESTFRYHYEPQAISAVRQWTQGYAQPLLMARGWDGATAEIAEQVVWWYDPGPLLTHPDRTADAINLYDRNVLSDDELLTAAGFNPETDKPSQQDFLVRLMSKFRTFPPNVVEAIIHRYDPSLEIPADKDEPGYVGGDEVDPAEDPSSGGDGGAPAPPAGDRSGRGGPPATPSQQAAIAASSKVDDTVATMAAIDRLLGRLPFAPEPTVTPTALPSYDVVPGQIEIRPIVADANPTGAMIALYPTAEQAAALAVDGGEAPEHMHVTLAYIGQMADLDPKQVDSARAICAAVAALHSPLAGTFGGVARFTGTDDGLDPVVATVDVQGLVALRNTLCEHLAAADVPMPSEHGYTPHCTLAYVAPDAPSPVDRLDPVEATFGAVSLVLGNNRTDYPLTGVAEPVVAATRPVSRTAEAASRRLADIDVQLRAKLRAAADTAVKRQIEKAAARIKSRLNGNATLRAQVRDVPPTHLAATLGREALTAAGIDLSAIATSDDYAALRQQFDAWVESAQDSALRAASRIAPIAAGTAAGVKAQQADHRDTAWAWLAGALAATAEDRLFDPDPSAPAVGEHDATSVVGSQLIRAAVAIAGGFGSSEGSQGLRPDGTPTDPSERLGGVGTGVVITATLEDAGAEVDGWEWVYGASVRPFEPHVALDGLTYVSHDDEQLANSEGWPEVEFFFPGDHLGCDCTESPTWVYRPDSAGADVSEAAVEESA